MAKNGIDVAKFERSIAKFAKQFGESNEQAVVRWGVQAARELAVVTSVFGGRSGGNIVNPSGDEGGFNKNYSAGSVRKRQLHAIWLDALNVIMAVDSATRTGKGWKITNQGKTYYVQANQFLSSPAEVNQWVRINRTRRRRRTPKLQKFEKKVALKKSVETAVEMRHKASGEAKGGWLAAGRSLAGKQTGAQRITIGAGYLSYAQKAGGTGSGNLRKNMFSPEAFLTNNVSHASDASVLSSNQARKAIDGALPNVLKWYRMAMRPKKSKP
jgi:hypothetical protein